MRISDWSSDVCSSDLPDIAAELFDTGVNMGPQVPVGFLQRALNAFNREQRDYADIVVDRQIGPKTMSALNAFLRLRTPGGEPVLMKAMETRRMGREACRASGCQDVKISGEAGAS